MKYFLMKDDVHINNIIKIKGFETRQRITFLKENLEMLKDISILDVEGKKEAIYPDFLECPIALISNRLGEVFDMYENTLVFKNVLISNLDTEIQHRYKLIVTDILDCISDKTIYHKDGKEKEIILEKKKIGNYNIFQIKGINRYYLIVSLEVVESILRRGFKCIEFEELKIV